MSVRLLTTAGAIIVSSLVLFTATVHLGADQATPRAAAKPWTAPLTPWGDPDIQGTFTTDDELGVPFERPAQFGTRTDVTDTEFADRQAQAARQAATDAEEFVAARTGGRGEEGVCLFLVPRDAVGLSIMPLQCIDQTRRPCEVVFDGVDVPASARLADERRGWKIVRQVIDAACVVLAADCLGGAQRALEMSVEYAKVRQQFGRPIGSFQAVKHIAAEMVSEIEPADRLCPPGFPG